MHILLTDLLTCPRCGPAFGLILLADRIADRRVLDGLLGCANCREKYSIAGGFADLGAGIGTRSGDASATDPIRLAALLGVTDGPGFVALIGGPAAHAGAIADMIPDIEIIAAADHARDWPERAGVSRLSVSERLPFANGKVRGVALGADGSDARLEEAARALAPLARLVLVEGGADAAERVRALGLTVLAQQGDTLVAVRG